MKHQQVFVQGLKADGSMGAIDVLRLEEASFRAFVVDALVRLGAVEARTDRQVAGAPILYREHVGELLKLTTV
jgi:hypothetical protein